MGVNPNLAVLMSGLATILFLLIVKNRMPSYVGTSASFVAAVAAIRNQGGDSADVSGAILIAGLILVVVGVVVHFGGAHLVRAALPPVVTGAVVMLIGFNLATVATTTYLPQEQWIGLLTAAFVIFVSVLARGFVARIAVFLLGAKIWIEARVDFSDPAFIVPLGAGNGGLVIKFSDDFQIGGIAAGTLIVLIGYRLCRALLPAHRRGGQQTTVDAP